VGKEKHLLTLQIIHGMEDLQGWKQDVMHTMATESL
jgi:hypothetical protein